MRIWTGFRFGHRHYAGVSLNRQNISVLLVGVSLLMLVGVIAEWMGWQP